MATSEVAEMPTAAATESANQQQLRKVKVPTGVRAYGGQRAIAVRWDADPEATGFQISRAENRDGPYEVINPGRAVFGNVYVDGSVFFPQGQPDQKTYFYRVNAFLVASGDIFERSANSEPASAITGPAVNSGYGLFPPDVSFSSEVDDRNSVELAVKFSSEVPGVITKVSMFRDPAFPVTDRREVRIWSEEGLLLNVSTRVSDGLFFGRTGVEIQPPFVIEAGKSYWVSMLARTGQYAAEESFFDLPHTALPLTATASAYRYGVGGVFPTETFRASNYFVEPTFQVVP